MLATLAPCLSHHPCLQVLHGGWGPGGWRGSTVDSVLQGRRCRHVCALLCAVGGWVGGGQGGGPGSPPETLEATTRQWLSELRYLGSTDRVLPPCFRRSCAYVRSIASRMQQQQQEQQQQQGPPGGYPAPATGAAAAAGPATAPPPQNFLQTALVDPSGARCLQGIAS